MFQSLTLEVRVVTPNLAPAWAHNQKLSFNSPGKSTLLLSVGRTCDAELRSMSEACGQGCECKGERNNNQHIAYAHQPASKSLEHNIPSSSNSKKKALRREKQWMIKDVVRVHFRPRGLICFLSERLALPLLACCITATGSCRWACEGHGK